MTTWRPTSWHALLVFGALPMGAAAHCASGPLPAALPWLLFACWLVVAALLAGVDEPDAV